MKRFIDKFILSGYINSKLILLVDTVVSLGSSIFAILLAIFFFNKELDTTDTIYYSILSLLSSIVAFMIIGLYKNIVRNANLDSLKKVITSAFIKCVLIFSIAYILRGITGINFNPLLIIGDFFTTVTALIYYRVLASSFIHHLSVTRNNSKARPAFICGTIDSAPLLQSLVDTRYSDKYRIEGFLTTRKSFKDAKINGLPVYYIENNDRSYEEFFRTKDNPTIIFPSYHEVKAFSSTLIKYCIDNSIPMMISPNLENLESEKDAMPRLREIEIEDLLERDPISIDLEIIRDELSGKLILITGAAGSIGSEIVRQVAKLGNVRLLLVDNAETPTHNLMLELREKFPDTNITIELGDIRSSSRSRNIIEKYHPDIIFHAAAYKHVPLMENNPSEAIMANVLGTRKIADLSIEFGVEKFIMISTDKAVNPTNIMGASKRIAEMYVQSLDEAIKKGMIRGKTKFITTRFGNVLGSNGSVIPFFKEQIKAGGPVTVTHPNIIRYFMTIPEACRLVLQASTMGSGGEIFVFDMGEQVKIVDLARRMIKLSGLIPDKDIKITFSGLRPGEKLYEEVLSDKETTFETNHPKIRGAHVRRVDYSQIEQDIEDLIKLAHEPYTEELVSKMKTIVPEFISNNSEFENLDKHPAEQPVSAY